MIHAPAIPMFALASTEEVLVKCKQILVGCFPAAAQTVASGVISIALILGSFGAFFAVATLLERKGLGRIQNRPGPNRVGPCGILQPVADGLKMLTKEDIVPAAADHVVHFLAPIAMLVPATLALAVIPYGETWIPLPLDAGLLFFFAVGAASELAAFMAGWSSHNKYSLLGALRAIAQMISFELPLVISTVAVLMITGTMSLPGIVAAQGNYWHTLPAQWHIFTPWGLTAFFIFLTAATAESNRSPFDLPEGESEIIGGFMTEYSGFKYAVFFMGEYFGMFAVSGLAITLFLGGWHAPLGFLATPWIPPVVWFGLKMFGLLAWFIWIRGTFPRLRADQLMNFAWKFLLPLAFINLLATMLWHFTHSWSFAGALAVRWLLCFGLVAGTFAGLGGALMRRRKWGPRVYRFAN